MAYEWHVKAWLMAERAAIHGEIAVKLARRENNDSHGALQQAEQMSRAMREGADSQFRELLWMIAHMPKTS